MKGILAAAAGILALDGHAANWCPTSTDYQITCSNCSRELTCDTYEISIEILGNNVTLDGQGYTINDAPNSAILVAPSSGGADATIKNVNIMNANWHGIHFSGGASSNWGYVKYVTINESAAAGIVNGGLNPIEIDSSYTYNNGYGVVGSYATYGAWTDFLHSHAMGNYYGYHSGSANSSWVKHNYFWSNTSVGADISYAQALTVHDNSFSGGSPIGLSIYESDFTSITDNYGEWNANYDCVVASSDNTYAYGNTWATYSGSGCVN